MDWIRDHLWETWLGLSIVLGVAEMFSLDLIFAMPLLLTHEDGRFSARRRPATR